jgi:hypothetical protein
LKVGWTNNMTNPKFETNSTNTSPSPLDPGPAFLSFLKAANAKSASSENTELGSRRTHPDTLEVGSLKSDPFEFPTLSPEFRQNLENARQIGLDKQKIASHGSVPKLLTTKMSEVRQSKVDFFWSGRIPLNKMTIIDGDPGTGKSTLVLDLIARATSGAPLPHSTITRPPASAILLIGEDGLGDTVAPRLKAAGANLDLVTSIDLVETTDKHGLPADRSFGFPEDLSSLEALFVETRAKFLVVDPLAHFMGRGVSLNAEQDVRQALGPLTRLCERLGVSLLAIRHLAKGNSQFNSTVYYGGGSIGIIALARAGLIVASHPNDPETKVLMVNKMNVGKPAKAITYRMVDDKQFSCSRIEWGAEINISPQDLFATQPKSESDRAEEFLISFLSNGARWQSEVVKAAKLEGLSERTLQRVKATTGVKAATTGGASGHWYWHLPDDSKIPSDPHPNEEDKNDEA